MKMTTKEVKLFPSQLEVLQATEQNIVAVLSRGYGKSYTVAYWCLYRLLTDSDIGMIVCPSYNMLRETTKYLLMHAQSLGLEYQINKKPHWCDSYLSDHKNIFSLNLNNGKHKYIQLCSADNPDSIRGRNTDFLALDECALLKAEVVDIATPCLRGKGSSFTYRTLMTTTPRDTSNWLYKRYVDKDVPSTKHIKASALENFIEFTQEKLDYYRSILTDLMWKREILAEWVDMARNAMFYAFSKDTHVKSLQATGKLFLSCDQNNVDLSSISGWINGEDVYIEKDIVIAENGNPLKVAQEFHKYYSQYESRMVYLFGDRYGKNKSLTSRSTYYDQLTDELKRLGWATQNKTNVKNPNVKDSTEKCNRWLEQMKLFVHPQCKETIRHFIEVKWKETEWVMDKKLLDSGLMDALRYVIWTEFTGPLWSQF